MGRRRNWTGARRCFSEGAGTASVAVFVLLVFALSAPFWAVGALTGLQLVQGLPVGALMAVCPLIAAVILTYRESHLKGTRELLKRAFDQQRIRHKIWYLPILLLRPGIMILSYFLMRWLGLPLPRPQFSIPAAVALFAAFFLAGIGEEVGWSGYAIDRMQSRWSALQASVVLGVVWAVWHLVPLAQAHRALAWIAWWCLGTVACRVLIVWLYNNTGHSVFAAVLHHAIDNVSWLMFPNFGSHFDPRVTGLITACVAGIVVLIWGPRTLTRPATIPVRP